MFTLIQILCAVRMQLNFPNPSDLCWTSVCSFSVTFLYVCTSVAGIREILLCSSLIWFTKTTFAVLVFLGLHTRWPLCFSSLEVIMLDSFEPVALLPVCWFSFVNGTFDLMSLSDGEAISSFMSAGSVRIYFSMHTLMFIVPKWKTTSLRSYWRNFNVI